MQAELKDLKIDVCPECLGNLERGFLIGKQNRIRWSNSTKGMTIFHGVPLIKLNKGFWKKRQWWLYAPNIPAKRCPKCRLVFFSYNNDAKETLNNEIWASSISGGLMFFLAILIGTIAAASWIIQPPITLLLRLGITLAAIIPFVLGLIFGAHAFKINKVKNRA